MFGIAAKVSIDEISAEINFRKRVRMNINISPSRRFEKLKYLRRLLSDGERIREIQTPMIDKEIFVF